MLKKVMQLLLVLTLSSNVFAATKDDVRNNYLQDALSLLLYDHLYLVTKNLADGTIHYTRSTNFKFNPTTGLITHGGDALEGFAMSESKKDANYVDIKIPVNNVVPAQATNLIAFKYVNLSSMDTTPANSEFSPENTNSFNFVSVCNLYDADSNPHPALTYYVKTSTFNTWKIYFVINGTSVANGVATFSSNGTLSQVTGLNDIVVPVNNKDQKLKLDLSALTQNGAPDNPGQVITDGHSTGYYSGFAIDGFGFIAIDYSNGMATPLFKIAMINN